METSGSAPLLLMLVAVAVAGPTQWQASDSKCSTRCPESVKFRYESGWSYEYQYEAETRTTVAGAAEDTAVVTITATAKIHVLDRCDMALRLTDVAVKRSHEEDSKRMVRAEDMSLAQNALEGQALRFAFYDGVVGEVCAGEGEDLWALNVKRGVLSAFQNSMRQLDRQEDVQEVDVTGQCPTHYRVTQQGWKSLTITKVKDILGCTQRNDYRSSLLSSPYTSSNSLQSLPLMKTVHECSQDVSKESAILERSSCHEVHVYRPFSKAQSGAVTEASHTLTFRNKARASRRSDPGSVNKRSSLLYEHHQGMEKGEFVFMDAKNKLKEICQATKMDIRPQVPRLFSDLVRMMRSLDYADLQDLSRQLDRNRVCLDNANKIKDFFQDALPMVATGASLRMMTGLLTSEEISDAQATFWITSLAFVSNPTKDMISAVQPLLKDSKRQEDSLLAVSALVNNYCEQHTDCTQHEEVTEVLDTLTDILGYGCQVRQDNLKQVLLTLRAIGNIGRSEAASLRLEKCFTQADNPMDVRVAALDAYRRMPCSADRNDAMEVFRRQSEDSELRIAAYLVVMRCPSDPVLDQVREALQDEEVNQVGSFVWTHLTNLLETASPHKQAVREVLENDLLQKEFRKDQRKFSRNTEISFFSDKFNLGGTYESNLVWSQNSFLPRSAMMNLTVDMFGHSVNLLELGGRVQGLEDLLQSTLFGSGQGGKDGGYGQTDVVKNGKLVRTKANFGKMTDDFRGQLYLRVFGNELAFGSVDQTRLRQLTGGKGKSSYLEELGKKLMDDGEVSFTHSAVFLDSSLIIPTVAGLPLNLTINGSASLEVQASQKMNFKKINAKSRAFEVAGMLQPSGAVELATSMSVDALVTRVGLRMTSRVHSSTALKGRVELARGQILSVEIDTPRDTLEILDFQSKFFIVHDGRSREQGMVRAGRLDKRACSGEPLARVLGVELCASLSFPNATTSPSAPYFPLTGPTALALTLTKHDVHSGYKLLAKQIQTSSSVITQVALDTPGSKVDRAISLGYVANLKAKTLEADLLSPWKKVAAQMSFKDTKKVTTADAAVTIDEVTQYKVHAEVAKDIKNNKDIIAKLKPSLEVTSNDGPLLSAKGSLDYRQNKVTKVNFVIDMKKVLRKPISVDYALVQRDRGGRMRYKTTLKASSQFVTLKGSMQGLVSTARQKKKAPLLVLKGKMDYNLHVWPRLKRNVVNLGLKLNDRSTAALAKYGINMNVDSKQVPEASLAVTGEVSHKKTLTKVELKVRHGQNVKAKGDKSKELLLSGFVAHKIADPTAHVSFDLKAIYPEKSIEYQLKGKHEHTRKVMEDYLTLRYAKGKSADAHLRLAQEKKKRSATFDLSYPAGKTHPSRVVKINADLLEKGEDHHILSAMASPQKGEKHSVVVSFKRPTPRSLDVSTRLDLHGRRPIKMDVSGNLAMRNMRGQGTLTFEGDTYHLEYTSDIREELYANFTMSFQHPQRRIQAALEGGRDREESVKRGKVEVMWDVDKDPSQKFGVTVEMADKVQPEHLNFGGMVEVFTPFQDYTHLKGELRLENSVKRMLALAETVLGDRQRQYSGKFLLAQPVSPSRLKAQAWLKTPHSPIRHLEVKADHTFDLSGGKLSTALKGVFNHHSLEVGVSGNQGGDGVVLRTMEGVAFLKSSLPAARSLRLTFTHRDTGGRFTTQTLADVNGDQYSATLEADYTKVHYQITSSGEVTIRAPQLASPVTLSWRHKNSLHEVTSSLTVQYPPNSQRAVLEVEGTVNVVTKVYEAQVKLTGPWKENGRDYVSKLYVKYDLQNAGYDLSAKLLLDKDSYDFHQTQKQTRNRLDFSSGMEMSRYPEYSYKYSYSVTTAGFPYTFSLEAQVAQETVLEFDFDVEKVAKHHKYRTTSRIILSFEDLQQKIVATTSHEKNRRGQWVNSGDVEYEPGKTITFSSVVDVGKDKKTVTLEVDTPMKEVRTIRLEYSHSGSVTEDFMASCSLTATPFFKTASTEVSWSRQKDQDRIRGNWRMNLPVKALRYFEVSAETWVEGGKRHSSLDVEHFPKQTYTLDTVYSCESIHDFDVMVNISTPRPEVPFVHAHARQEGGDNEFTGLYKLVSPAMAPYDEMSVSYNHRHTEKSFASHVVSVLGSQNTWTTRSEFSWDDEISGLFSVENNGKGRQKTALLLSHKGHTYEDFRTKASFRMNGDRLEGEVAYSNRDGRSGVFMLATPDPDLDYFKTTFFQRRTEGKFEGRYTAQYGEASKPYDLGLMTTYSDDTIAFSTDLKTPHSEDLAIEIGFATKRRVEVKLLGKYGSRDKIAVLVKYNIKNDFWNIGGDFEYMVQGSGRNIGFMFKRDGPLDNLKVSSTAKYMGEEVTVDAQYQDAQRKAGRVEVRTSFRDYTNLAAAFNHSGNSEKFNTDIYLKYKDDKEAKGTIDFLRNKWKRVQITSTLRLPYEDFQQNKLTYKHVNRKNRLTAEGTLKLGSSRPLSGNLEFADNSKLTVSVSGPYKDFVSLTATGTYDEANKKMEGDASVKLSKGRTITGTYMVRAGIWPVMVNVKAQTPFQGWETVELSTTHDGVLTDFTSSYTLTSEFLGTVQSELVWSFHSASSLSGLWTLTSGLQGAQDLKVSLKNTEAGNNEFNSHLVLGWELMKEIVVDATVELPDSEFSNRYKGKLEMTTPLPEVSQVAVSFDHDHGVRLIQDTVTAHFNGDPYLDAEFSYNIGDRRVGRVEFRQPRPMEFLVGGAHREGSVEGELKLNWDKRNPAMNVHLTGDYADRGDGVGIDTNMKFWAIHPVRTLGLEYLMRRAAKEVQSDFLLTWNKEAGQTLSYVINWTDRSSRYSTAYDATVKVGVPMRSVQVEGAYSDTGRARAARGWLMWDADRDQSLKLGLRGELQTRADSHQLQMGLDLPFISKEYSLTTETAVNSGNKVLDARTEFSYSPDPRRTLVVTTLVEDLSYGQQDTANFSLALGLVHPMTDLDLHLACTLGHSPARSSAASRVVYMVTGTREKKEMSLRGEIDRMRRVAALEVNTPVKNVALEAHLTGLKDHNVELVSKENSQRSKVANIYINPETRTLETTLWYDEESPSSSMTFFGHLVTDQLLQTELYRTVQGQRVSETLMTLRLNNSHLLHTRLNWRPNMLTDLQQYIGRKVTVFSHSSSQRFQRMAGGVGGEVTARHQAIMQEVREEATPLFEHFQREMETLQKDLETIQTGLRRFYYQNALHVQDMSQVINNVLKTMVDGMHGLGMRFRQLQAQWEQEMGQIVQGMGQYPMAQVFAQLVTDFAAGIKNSRVMLEQTLNELSVAVGKFSDLTYRRYLLISRKIDRKLKGYTAALRQSSHYQSLSSLGSHLSSGNYRELAKATSDRLLEALDRLGLKESYVALTSRAKRLLADQFHDIVQRPEFQQLYVIGGELYQQGVWAYHYWQVEENMQLAVGQLLKLAKDITLLEITRIKDAVVDLDKSRVIVFDPKHGELQFEIHLPVALKSLAAAPDVRVLRYVRRARVWLATYLPSPRLSLWTYLNSYLPSTDTDTWIPPFTGHAFVMGDHHVVTFDGRHYNFAGRCSYVLARDMAEDRFTVVLQFNNRPRHPQVQALLVLMRGLAVEVGRDNKVKVNDKETELPFFSGVVSAVRHQSVIRVQDGQALTVEIDNARGIYSVALSGWYHGRTAGLLGTFDNEPYNDLTDSSRQLTEDMEDFTNSWEVGKRFCRSRNLADSGPLEAGDVTVAACSKFLNHSSSYFSPCFGLVDASELVSVCVSLVKTRGLSVQEAQCRAGQHYRYMCGRLGISLGTPAVCVSCEMPGDEGSLGVGEQRTLEMGRGEEGGRGPAGWTADVVFVVEENSCNSWAQRFLPPLATQLSQALQARGLTDNRFGLVSYAGNGSQDLQLVHTIEGQVFGNPNNFLKAAENLRLTYPSQPGSAEGALQKAAQFPFRVGAAKVLVLLPCSACQDDLYALQHVLRAHGFTLHVLGQQGFSLTRPDGEGAAESPVRIYGMDSSRAHTQKSGARRTADLYRRMSLSQTPILMCAELALATNGSVFDVGQLKGRGRVQKEFLQAFAARGALGAHPASCQLCSCHDDGTGRGHTVCRPCHYDGGHAWKWNHIPQWLQSSSTSVMGVFNDLHHQIITSLEVPKVVSNA